MKDMTGRCLCGAVRWQITGPVLWQAHCHCESCRRNCAAPFTTFIGVRRDHIAWSGPAPARHVSAPGVSRGFCSGCGTPVLFESDRWPDETHVYAASLDEPEQCRPGAHVNWSERVSWVSIDDELPKYATTSEDGPPI